MTDLILTHEPTTLPQGCDEWRTPGWLFAWAEQQWGPFTLDAAARETNRRCKRYCGPGSPLCEDGASWPWTTESAWCNPPFSDIGRFIDAACNARHAVLLVPANRTEQLWFGVALQHASDMIFIRPRVAYVDPLSSRDAPKFASMLIVFDARHRGICRVRQMELTPGTAGPGLFEGRD